MLLEKAKKVITGYLEDDCNYSFRLVDLDILDDMEKEELINLVDFDIKKDSNYWSLIDNQGGNLGDIESDEFEVGRYDDMIDRLDIYWKDYGILFTNEFTKEEIERFEIID